MNIHFQNTELMGTENWIEVVNRFTLILIYLQIKIKMMIHFKHLQEINTCPC